MIRTRTSLLSVCAMLRNALPTSLVKTTATVTFTPYTVANYVPHHRWREVIFSQALVCRYIML